MSRHPEKEHLGTADHISQKSELNYGEHVHETQESIHHNPLTRLTQFQFCHAAILSENSIMISQPEPSE